MIGVKRFAERRIAVVSTLVSSMLLLLTAEARAQFKCQQFLAGDGGAIVGGTDSLACGTSAFAAGIDATAVGVNATANGNSVTAIGSAAGNSSNNPGNTFVGASAGISGNGQNNTMTGAGAGQFTIGNNNSAYGFLAGGFVQGSGNVAIGANAGSGHFGFPPTFLNINNTVAVGTSAMASADNAIAVGANANAGFVNSTAIGQGAATTRADQQMFGMATNTYTMPGITSAASKAAQGAPTAIVTSNAAGDLAAYTPSQLGLATTADIASLNASLRRGIAATAAMAHAPTPSAPGRTTLAVNGSIYEDTGGVGVAFEHRFANTGIPVYILGGYGNGGGREHVGRAGLAIEW